MDGFRPPAEVVGIDFGVGRRDAGEQLWIATGEVVEGDLHVCDCRAVADLLDAPADRATTLRALTAHVAGLDGGVAIGCDFPFGLPESVVSESSWVEFLQHFPGWVNGPEALGRRCASRAALTSEGVRARRATDEPLGALSPYSVRLQAHTFYGLRDVLRPLVLSGRAAALPMQEPGPERPLLLETYTAATVDDLAGASMDHRGGSREHRAANLRALAEAAVETDGAVRERVLADAGGDGLDALFAAFAAYRNTRDTTRLHVAEPPHALEGHIYV